MGVEFGLPLFWKSIFSQMEPNSIPILKDDFPLPHIVLFYVSFLFVIVFGVSSSHPLIEVVHNQIKHLNIVLRNQPKVVSQ